MFCRGVPTSGPPYPCSSASLRFFALACFLLTVASASATDKFWSGPTNTTWGTGTNWTGSLPASTDNAVFNSTFTNQPNLGTTATAGGIWMTTGVGQNVTISGSTLTLQGNAINGTAGLGILVDNANPY